MAILPKDVDDVTFAFPADVSEYLPKMEDIPKEFHIPSFENKWMRLFSMLFYGDKKLDDMWIIQKEGIDPTKAGRHIMCIMKSYQPKHEHKIAGCTYLMSEWFEDWGISENPIDW